MKFNLLKRNLLFLALMSFYASCGREDIFDDRRDLVAEKYHEPHQQEILEVCYSFPGSAWECHPEGSAFQLPKALNINQALLA